MKKVTPILIILLILLVIIWFIRRNRRNGGVGCKDGSYVSSTCSHGGLSFPSVIYDIDSCVPFDQIRSYVLQKGAFGCGVYELQYHMNQVLSGWGCTLISTDGMFGCETEGALKYIYDRLGIQPTAVQSPVGAIIGISQNQFTADTGINSDLYNPVTTTIITD